MDRDSFVTALADVTSGESDRIRQGTQKLAAAAMGETDPVKADLCLVDAERRNAES